MPTAFDNATRIEQLEQTVAEQQATIDSLIGRHVQLDHPRDVRLAKTTYTSSYPQLPANTYEIVFVDGFYTKTAGTQSAIMENRSGAAQDYAHCIYGPLWLESNTYIYVMRQNGKWWILDRADPITAYFATFPPPAWNGFLYDSEDIDGDETYSIEWTTSQAGGVGITLNQADPSILTLAGPAWYDLAFVVAFANNELPATERVEFKLSLNYNGARMWRTDITSDVNGDAEIGDSRGYAHMFYAPQLSANFSVVVDTLVASPKMTLFGSTSMAESCCILNVAQRMAAPAV